MGGGFFRGARGAPSFSRPREKEALAVSESSCNLGVCPSGAAGENIGHAKTPLDAPVGASMRAGRNFMRENARVFSRRFWW